MAAKSLILVENANKAKTLKKLCGTSYSVLSTEGFLKAMPKSRLAIDEENNYAADYKTIRGQGSNLKKLKKETLNAGRIFIATNPNAEGEFLANQCCEIFGINEQSHCRIICDELTKTAVKSAIANAQPINMNLVEAYQARQLTEKIVNFKIKEYFSYKIWRGNQIGRLRAIILKLISEVQPAGTFKISEKLNSKTLQELAARDLNFSATKTRLIASQLYEGINFGKEGYIGLISFPDGEIKLSSENRTPESVENFLNSNQLKLYELIYKAVNNGFSTEIELDGTTTNLALMVALDKLQADWAENFSICILSLSKREYVTFENSIYKITELGEKILNVLEESFKENFSITAYNNFNAQLKEISDGKAEKIPVIENYCKSFNKNFEKAMAALPEGAKIQEIPLVETDEICDKCGHKMLLKHGKYGKFFICSNSPECKNVKPYVERLKQKCPKCGSQLRKRAFNGGHNSYTCENPECDFRTWDDPMEITCKTCGSTVFLHKFKGRTPMPYCGNENCPTRKDHPINKILADAQEKSKSRKKI